jgi:DeoR/GlpR family transcriptional regulator of sugar metabolism
MASQLDVSVKTIWRDTTELKEQGVIERTGNDFSGEWRIVKKSEKK